jgi:anti-anti-sigma factor
LAHGSDHDPRSDHRRYPWLGPADHYHRRLVEVLGDRRHPTLRCAGEFDAASCDELEAALEELCERELESLHLDLAEVRFLDGYALGLIAATQLRLERRGVALRATVEGQPRRMFELSGLEIGSSLPESDAA